MGYNSDLFYALRDTIKVWKHFAISYWTAL